jgi:hypothetical protein
VQSAWFQNYIKQTIIASTEESTGGKAEIGTFHFDWRHLTAVATDFVIHGTEPAGAAPMLRVARVQLNLRLFTSIHHLWDITYLGIDASTSQRDCLSRRPYQYSFAAPQTASSESPLETVVDLAIGRFELTNGLITLAAQKHELNVRGNNLRAQLSYNILSQEYRGQVSLQPNLCRFRPKHAGGFHGEPAAGALAQSNRCPRRQHFFIGLSITLNASIQDSEESENVGARHRTYRTCGFEKGARNPYRRSIWMPMQASPTTRSKSPDCGCRWAIRISRHREI